MNKAAHDPDSIANLVSGVFDNGRRGAPRQGCDCVQCFGYCQIDRDVAMRGQLCNLADAREVRNMDVPVDHFMQREERE